MIELWALRMAEGIKRRTPDHPASIAVMKHALAILINTTSIIILSLTLGITLGHGWKTAIALTAFALLRMVTGGVHVKTGMMCVLITTGLFVLIALIEVERAGIYVLTLLSFIMVFLWAPAGIEKQSRIPKHFYPHLRYAAAFLVLGSLLVMSETVALCFFIQSLTLFPVRERR